MANQIEPFYVAMGRKIQDIREGKKMTQAQLGRCLNPPTTRASIANIENGKQRVLAHTLMELAKAMEVDIKDLIPSDGLTLKVPPSNAVFRELKRKLNLAPMQLRKLGIASTLPSGSGRNKR
jgi:transcriptional regulator with XRE-family HTH domain